MSLEDARFSVIRYLASPIPNAYGPNVHDPRSGEIIESHIGWYHNVMELLHDWYQTQVGALDPRARKPEFDEALMGELIRFVSSHEVGHTLGLRHNMGASSATPVENLRDKAWVEKYGHPSSIMDYARFNSLRLPAAHQLDLRVDKEFYFRQWAFNLYFDVQNVYRSANPMAPIYTNLSPQGQPMIDPADNDRYLLRQIPSMRGTVLPAMGVMVKF